MPSFWFILISLVLLWSLFAAVGFWGYRWLSTRQRAREILSPVEDSELDQDFASLRWLSRWLYLAGYRRRAALPIFLCLTIATGGLGFFLVWTLQRQGTIDLFAALLTRIPGGVGEVFLPIAWASPWLIVLALTFLPAMFVRSARRRRVGQVEQDLPLVLDLLATLAEAGLGFDSSVDRVLAVHPARRPLAQELRLYQTELMAGRGRISALRRLSDRLDVMWFTIFVSALVQAERLGTGLANVLRIQADDLRSRRRERAVSYAMSLPSKLVFPLVACFLPGIA
ncbi:MAG TPA: type II secretion system F family protein, partial [Planctomicrobium sp.]|nr:type II secretion system F family protein [Planctomicrobium sp.]